MKKLLSIFIAVILMLGCFSLIACGKDNGADNGDGNGGGNGGGEIVQPDNGGYPELEKSKYAGTEIEFYHFWNTADETIKAMAKRFEEGTGIKVKVSLSPVSTHLQSLNTKMQTNTMPALYTMWPGATMPGYIDAGWVADLSDYKAEWVDRMTPFARNACTTNGKLYIAPVNMAFVAIAYNKEVFKRNNVEPPKNMADFERIMDVLKQDKELGVPFIWGQDTGNNMRYMLSLSTVYQQHPDFDEQVSAGTLKYNEEMKPVYERLYIDWAAKGYYNVETYQAYDRMTKGATQFIMGKTGMIHMGSFDVAVMDALIEESDKKVEYGMFPVPGIDNDGSLEAAAGEAIAVNAKLSENEKGAAMEFLDYYFAAQNNSDMCGAINSLSPYNGVKMNAVPAITELSKYLDDTARGWDVTPLDVQSKFGEAGNIHKGKTREEQVKLMQEHLDYLQEMWMNSVKK